MLMAHRSHLKCSQGKVQGSIKLNTVEPVNVTDMKIEIQSKPQDAGHGSNKQSQLAMWFSLRFLALTLVNLSTGS